MSKRNSSLLVVGLETLATRAGGLNRYVDGYVEALRQEGVSLEVLAASVDASGNEGYLGSPQDSLLKRSWKARQIIARSSARSVDIHFAPHAFLAVITGALKARRVIMHFHGPWAGELEAAGAAKYKVAIAKFLEGVVYRRADQCITLSEAFASELATRYDIPRDRIAVIAPGLDLERFSLQASNDTALSQRALRVVTVRRLQRRMGLDLLLAALAKVRDAGVALELEILGKGPERANLEALSDELGLQDHVRFAGFVADEDLATHYGAADLSLVPTVAHEGFGLVVLESLACGTPVLASDLGGLSEVLGSFSPEMLVKPGDVDALAGALMAIARQETPLATAQRCRDYAEAFSWKASVTQQLALLTGEQLPRVAIFGHHAKLSGGELAMARQVPALNFADITVILGSPGPLVDRLRSDGIRVELLALPADLGEVTRAQANGLAGLRSAFASLRYVFRLARYLRKQRFDILQTNTLKAALIGGLAGRLSGTRVVWHLRDRITDDYLGHRSALAVRLAAKILPSWVIANSVSTAKTLRADLQEMTVIASPIDPSIVAVDRQSRDASQPMRIGIMGRLAAWKGQDLFLSAFAEAFSATAVEAVVIGSPLFGEEDFAAQLEAQAKSLSIASQVDFRGFREDVAAELARLDILVHASILPEPFGQVIVEGMASGLAVIVSNAGGAGEIISDDLDGLLVDPGDREALKNAMLLLVHDQQLRTRLGLAALETAKAYRREGLSERYREVWSGLMGASLRV